VTIRKRRQPTPGFRLPPPYNPFTGEHAPVKLEGTFPYCALMQVAAEDTEDDYVICRGYDPRIDRYIDYESGNADKPGIPVAKPYGARTTDQYEVGEVHEAFLPVCELGQTPGVAASSSGHPADLDEDVEILYTTDGKVINWMLAGGATSAGTATLWLFSLNENMGATTVKLAAADKLNIDNTDTDEDIEVEDPLNLFSALQSGAVGFCIEQYIGDTAHYIIIQAACP